MAFGQIYSLDTGDMHPVGEQLIVGGDDSLLLAGARGLHDAVDGSVGIIHFDAHLHLMDENAPGPLQLLERSTSFSRSISTPSIQRMPPERGRTNRADSTSRFALDAVRALASYCHAMAITEVNPMTDVRDMTSTLAAYLAFGFAVFGSQAAS